MEKKKYRKKNWNKRKGVERKEGDEQGEYFLGNVRKKKGRGRAQDRRGEKTKVLR